MAGRESKSVRRDRANRVLDALSREFPGRYCFLEHDDPFQLLVAVILSAQCTDAQVNRVTPRLFAAFPTAEDLAEAPRAEVERLIFSTGFYKAKARNIQATAQAIVERFGGAVPADFEALVTLPGVARKTANVVMTNAFGRDEGICVDTHVGRVARRLGLTRETDPVKVERDLVALYPQSRWGDVPFYFILHGRNACDAKKPRCGECPVAEMCPKKGVAKALPAGGEGVVGAGTMAKDGAASQRAAGKARSSKARAKGVRARRKSE